MITGINTDVDFQEVTYHVQTEDKGLATPLILSLVYNRGTILASKRSPYDDLIVKGFDEKVLAERLQKQHKTICAAIRAGRIEDLKKMTAKDSAAKQKSRAVEVQTAEIVNNEIPFKHQNPVNLELNTDTISVPKIETRSPVLEKQPVQTTEKQILSNYSNNASRVSVYKGAESPIPKPKYDFNAKSVSGISRTFQAETIRILPTVVNQEQIIEAVEIIDDDLILPAEAVAIVSDKTENKSADNRLMLEILGDDIFKSGEKKTMSILVHRGNQQNGLSESQVMVKVLGAAFRPLIFHGKTDEQGIAKIHLQMPLFKQGRAAILIKAMSEGEETELRRTIKHK